MQQLLERSTGQVACTDLNIHKGFGHLTCALQAAKAGLLCSTVPCQVKQRISGGSEHRKRHAQERHAPNDAMPPVILLTELAPYLMSKRHAQERHTIMIRCL